MTTNSSDDIGSTNQSVLGTVTTGTWAATTITPNHGGTGVANAVGSTITLGGPLVTTGANSVTFNTTGPTSVTLPTSGTLGSGIILQVVQGLLTTVTTLSSATPTTTGLTVTITPTNVANNILIMAMVTGGAANALPLFLYRGAAPIFNAPTAGSRISCTSIATAASTSYEGNSSILYMDSPATTAATTYSIYFAGLAGGAVSINASVLDTNSSVFTRSVSSIIAMEVVA